jgi:predicted HTH transcriptional regulator
MESHVSNVSGEDKQQNQKSTQKPIQNPIQNQPHDPMQRNFFFSGEILKDEDRWTEYKMYNFLFERGFGRQLLSENLISTLKKSVNAFLNNQDRGGIIFVGVGDDCVVKGLVLSPGERNILIRFFENYIFNDFFPTLNDLQQQVFVDFVEVEDAAVENLYVLRIIVDYEEADAQPWFFRQGTSDTNCYVRKGNQTIQLVGQEMVARIITQV